MTLDELLAESLRVRGLIENYLRTQQSPAAAPAPLAPASGFDSEALLRKPTGNLTAAEIAHLRSEVSGVLKDLGH